MAYELFQIAYSPWSERARWALDHHRLEFQPVEHKPVVGELALRRRTGRWKGLVSVPVLRCPDGPVFGSMDVVRWADAHGSSRPLMLATTETRVLPRVERADRALEAARSMITRRMFADARVRREQLPRPMRSFGLLSDAVAFAAVAMFKRKYGFHDRNSATRDCEDVRSELEALQKALEGGRPYLLEEFSLADVAMASMLQIAEPVADAHWKIGTRKRAQWRTPELAAAFPDLLSWRDQLYESHRRPPARQPA